ncbi:MAG: (Fe-S)-binding protein [Anaerolineales bacterium]
MRTIARGNGKPNWKRVPSRLLSVIYKTGSFAPVFDRRFIVSLFHGLVGWGFIYYLLVNIGDVLGAFIPGFELFGGGRIGDLYRLGADLLSVAVLIGMAALMIRRFGMRPDDLKVREQTQLNPKARAGIARDSAIVGAFILVHVGARFLGESFHLGALGGDAWRPAASAVAGMWNGWSGSALETARHAAFWVSLGTIMAFTPYFLYSKHLHLFMAPINFLLQPERRSMGALDPLDFEDQSIEEFGVERLEQLSYKGILDAYACIMCNRCQDACPAYQTGKVLSPAALEINKRYFLNQEGGRLAAGEASSQTMVEAAISEEAIWGCTACGACIEACPVANEPMRDILELRRHLVLMQNAFPEQLQAAYRGMERTANPWGVPPEKRLEWAEGLSITTVAEQPHPELLWWVGCAPATDPRAQGTARAFARLLQAAGVEYAVLGREEQCTGDAARRSGNEYLFHELASANVERLNQVAPGRIVTTCPHCLHTLKNEYPDFGGHYEVIHHTQLIDELLADGRLELQGEVQGVTYHDPCYLGRQNGVIDAPRQALQAGGLELIEMARHGHTSFCCGAGGAQMWKEEEEGTRRVSAERLAEAKATGQGTLATGCPFCMIMLNDAAKAEPGSPAVRDVAELIAERLPESAPPPAEQAQRSES